MLSYIKKEAWAIEKNLRENKRAKSSSVQKKKKKKERVRKRK
jgi:hypothetical protein